MGFIYADSWLSTERALPLSLSLPLTASPYRGGPAHWFFVNLLPEGPLRRRLMDRLGLFGDDHFALLAAIGGDCVGDLSMTRGDRPPGRGDYRPLSNAELEALTTPDHDLLVELLGNGKTRLALAGVQNKLPVRVEEGRIMLPLAGAPGSHILKIPGEAYPHLAANEVLMSMIGRRCGLEVPETTLLRAGDNEVCLVKRFDRESTDGGELQRLHQEDLCQARGKPPRQKYEADGGPSFAECMGLVRGHSVQAVQDARGMLRWQMFNLLCGNSDGHAKNLSLLYREPGKPTLAPAYDLVCTRIYPQLSRMMALSVGGELDPDQVGHGAWVSLANKLVMRPGILLTQIEGMAKKMPVHAREAAQEFRQTMGDSPALDKITAHVRKQAQLTLQLLDQE